MSREERRTHVPIFLLRGISAWFQSMRHERALEIGAWIGDFLRVIMTSKAALTRRNLEQAFPELAGTKEIEKLEREIFRHFGKVGAEFMRFPVLSEDWIKNHVTVEGFQYVNELLEKGRGVLAFSAHYGNWEMALKRIALESPSRIHVVIRRIKDQNVHSFIEDYREHYGGAISILQDHGAISILKILKRNGIVVTVLDQNSSVEEGVFSPFFGRPAATYSSIARMAMKLDIPLLPVFDARVSDVDHHVRIGPPISLPELPEPEAIQSLTNRATSLIEQEIRNHPEQWIWMHNRWKTVPPDNRFSP